MGLLEYIHLPSDLKQLSLTDLEQLADEIRQKIIRTVLTNGGHLASPLGVVELTLAIHYVFEVGEDIVIWDVGHQAYAHKLITGRNAEFHTLRTKGGISGFPRPSESPYDFFGTGHSSTSISAGLGMAIARDLKGEDRHIIAVIGDGAMTGGMAMEALNHAGHLRKRLIVVLNDNEMSIAPNIGALAKYFNRLITAHFYKRAKEDVGSFVKKIIGERATRTIQDLEKSVKGFITKGVLFQELGFNYIGPIDGHDLPLLIECFRNIKLFSEPVLVHCKTEKGKGYTEAEKNPQKYHGIRPKQSISKSDEEGDGVSTLIETVPTHKTFTDHFSKAICELAEKDERIIAITAAMPEGTGLAEFASRFPERFFDVGICEPHAVTLSAGLATQGFRPVVAIYSTFLQRAFDQIIHDVCLQNLPVIFAIDRAGLVGEDGPTHMGTFDLSYLRLIPNLHICAPSDGTELEALLAYALTQNYPVAIRYPKAYVQPVYTQPPQHLEQADILYHGDEGYYLAVGSMVKPCIDSAQRLREEYGISMGVVNVRWIKPLDVALLSQLTAPLIICVEENTVVGGFGSGVLEWFNQHQLHGAFNGTKISTIGVPDIFPEQATREEQLEMYGLNVDAIMKRTLTMFEQPYHLKRE